MTSTLTPAPIHPPGRGRLARWMLLLSLLACIVAAVGVLWFKYASTKIFGPLQPPQMAAAQFAARDAVGDLGGIPVTIPRHFANYVEYEGDPG